jgi:hypothetical protein
MCAAGDPQQRLFGAAETYTFPWAAAAATTDLDDPLNSRRTFDHPGGCIKHRHNMRIGLRALTDLGGGGEAVRGR